MIGLPIPVFTWILSTSKILTPVDSEPVPAVVGTAIIFFNIPGTGSPFPKGALTKVYKSTGNVVKRFTAFAVSITEPPPTAQIESNFVFFANSIAWRNDLSVGSIFTWSYNV